MLQSNGALRTVRFTEVVRISEGSLGEVPLYSTWWKTCPHSHEWSKCFHYFSPKFFSGASIKIYGFLAIRGVPYLS